jgi:hypothetical protein
MNHQDGIEIIIRYGRKVKFGQVHLVKGLHQFKVFGVVVVVFFHIHAMVLTTGKNGLCFSSRMIAGAYIQQTERPVAESPLQKTELGNKRRREGFKIHAQIYKDDTNAWYWSPGAEDQYLLSSINLSSTRSMAATFHVSSH